MPEAGPATSLADHRSDRKTSLSGQNAVDWLASIGFTSRFLGNASIHFDLEQDGLFAYARAHHAPMEVRVAEFGGSEVVFAFVILKGSVHLLEDATGREYTLGPGDSYAFPSSVQVTQVNPTPIAKIGVSLDSESIAMSSLPGLTVVRSHESDGLARVVVVLVNALLAVKMSADEARRRNLRAAVEHAVIALYRRILDHAALTARGPDRLVRRALDRIDRFDQVRKYSVAELAADLNVSDAHLRRVFRSAGSSPSAALTRARVARAQALLRVGAEQRLTAIEIAERSGFSSAASMRRALRKHVEHPRDAEAVAEHPEAR
ncbi:helix-turn-helix domain-containing protein [Pseudoclavibacter helvolus]|uniref:helix-turn-helix domain-containing protein n=1 Tax=Pseudoclavibacter helvolus TaxID=255205 RepID=UPI003C71FA6F